MFAVGRGVGPAVRPVARLQADGIAAGVDVGSAALAERAAASGAEARTVDRLASGAELIRSATPIRASNKGAVRGVVIASHYLPRIRRPRARDDQRLREDYQQLHVLKGPVTGVYVSFFLMLTLMILVGATWMGLYMAKRITRPVQLLAETAAHAIGAGRFDYRVEVQSHDEFGSLAEAFNMMAGELATSRQRLEHSAVELERKHQDVEGRRRYVETVLERVASGVVSVDAAGRIRTWNSAARRLLGIDSDVSGQRAEDVFGARRISDRTKSMRSAGLVILLQATTVAPALVMVSTSALFRAPPAWWTNSVTPSTWSAQYAASADARSFAASWAPLITTNRGSANRLGATRSQNSPGARPAATASRRSTPGSARRAAAVALETARSTSSISSPVTNTSGGSPGAASWPLVPVMRIMVPGTTDN